MKIKVNPVGRLSGEVIIPGDKSISHRAVMLGSLAKGTTLIKNFLMGEDCISTINAFRQMGIDIRLLPSSEVLVNGKGLHGLSPSDEVIDAGNSGTTTRLLMGILAGQPFSSTLDGDSSLRKRPMKRVALPLARMGAEITGSEGGDRLPLTIKGRKLTGIDYTLPVASAQVKSAIILATLFTESPSIIRQPAVSRDHTELMLQAFGGRLAIDGKVITAYPAEELYSREISVPGDISSAAFFLTAALLIPDSAITLKDVGINPTRTGILEAYKRMGADIRLENERLQNGEPAADIAAAYGGLKSTVIDGEMIPKLIDEIPIIALAATQAQGTTVIRDAAELKVKESDRIKTVADALKSMGANVEPTDDGMIIHGPTPLSGSTITCSNDHRIAMMGAIAGLIARGETILDGGQWVNISFPGFFEHIERLGS